MPKLIRITTVPMALKVLLPGQAKYMKAQGYDVILVSSDGIERQDVMANEGCEHRIISMTRKITPFADLNSLWQLYKLFRQEKPDIIHSHTPKAGLLAMLAGKLAGIKIRIHTVAGLRFMTSTGATRSILVWMEKITAACATHVWPNSKSLLGYIKKNRLASDSKLEVIGAGSSNGINLKRYSTSSLDEGHVQEVKQLIKYDSELTYLLFVGRIVKDKGVDELLDAFDRLYKENNRLRLIMVGSYEDDLDPVSDKARHIMNNHPGIIMVGWRNDAEYFMHLAYALVHPSYREGFPNVLLQAGAMMCPVIWSRIEGNVDVVDHGKTGLVFEVRNADDLYRQLSEAIANPVRMRGYSSNLRGRIEREFDQAEVHKRLSQRYQELLRNGQKEG